MITFTDSPLLYHSYDSSLLAYC